MHDPIGSHKPYRKTHLAQTHFHSKRVDNVQPNHANDLRKTGLAPTIYPTIGELWKGQDEKRILIKKNNLKSTKEKYKYLYFVTFSRYFSTSIHSVTSKQKNHFISLGREYKRIDIYSIT